MASNDYQFVTRWRVEGTVEDVADVLADPLGMVRWWPSFFRDVKELEPGDENGLGRVLEYTATGWLPYSLRWTLKVVESRWPNGSTLEASGDLTGRGIWTLEQDGSWVNAVYDWKVTADKPLLRYMSFALWPIFAANHNWVMTRGEESLNLELARRHAKTPEERAAVPPPPGPTFQSPAPLLLGATAAIAAIGVGLRLIRPRKQGAGGNGPGMPGLGAGFDESGQTPDDLLE